MNVKLKALTAGVLFFTGQAVMAQKDSLKTENIDEVVLVGYGTQKKSNVTGAIATVKSDVLQEQPVASVELALQGKAPGVQVASTGGRAGNNTKISIRGNGSLSASNNPLYIIDGVPQEGLGNLAPEDIVTMQILKDAASSAIYGSKASNGVVLLETKSGMKGDIAAAGVEAEELIKSGKFSISANPKENSSEVILKFAGNVAEENGSWGWIMSYDARTWNCFAVADDLLALLGTNDTRRSLFDIAQAPSTGNFVFSNKYSRSDDSDLLISRIPEMYLISAEAGNTARLTELQSIRHSNLSLDNERRLELSFEWVRWSDLKLKGETYKLPFPQGAVDANDLLEN